MKHIITHVRKDDQDNIIAVKTINLALHTHQVVELINKNLGYFYVAEGFNQIPVGVYKEKWIRSYADGIWTNNLDNLPRF